MAVVALRSGRSGRALARAQVAMAALLLLLLLHRAVAGGGGQVCESEQSAADPSPTWHGPAAWSRRRLAAPVWWRVVASSRLSRYTRDTLRKIHKFFATMLARPSVLTREPNLRINA